MTLDEMKAAILADGIVDADEVEQMKTALYEDGVIDKDEMDFLVSIADAVAGAENDPSFKDLYVGAVKSRYLEDEESPGAIDEAEASEIIELFWGDGNLNDYEKAALSMIKAEATNIHTSLAEKIDFLGL